MKHVINASSIEDATKIDYLITNVKLYFDRFENQLEPMVDEPSTPEYDEREAGEDREEDFKLEEYIDLDGLLEGIHR